MLKMLQILRYMKDNGMTLDQIMAELTEIIDNGQSEYFELSAYDIERISRVFHNDELFDSALKSVLS